MNRPYSHESVLGAAVTTLATINGTLSEDYRFIRTSRQQWGLRAWGISEYLGIAHAIGAPALPPTEAGPSEDITDEVLSQFPDVTETSIRCQGSPPHRSESPAGDCGSRRRFETPLIGLNEISRSSSLRSWPAYAPRMSSASRTLAIFAPPITGLRPSTSEAKAARNAACRLRLYSCRSSRRTSIAVPSGFQVVLSAKQATAPRPCGDGPRDHRYSWGVTANQSPAEHCNHESCGPSSVLAPKRNLSQVNRPGSDGGSGYWISTRGWSVRFVA